MNETVNTETKEMDFFKNIFPKSNERYEAAMKEHEERMEKAAGSPSMTAAEERRFHKELTEIGDGIIKRDRALFLEFPFKINDKKAKNLNECVDYYIKTKIVEVSDCQPVCISCGEVIKPGEVYVEMSYGQGETVHVAEVDPKLVIDGIHVKLKVCK